MIPVPPPYEVQQRAADCAWVLRGEFADRLSLEQNIRAQVALAVAPDRLGWAEIGDMLSLYHTVVEVRV